MRINRMGIKRKMEWEKNGMGLSGWHRKLINLSKPRTLYYKAAAHVSSFPKNPSPYPPKTQQPSHHDQPDMSPSGDFLSEY